MLFPTIFFPLVPNVFDGFLAAGVTAGVVRFGEVLSRRSAAPELWLSRQVSALSAACAQRHATAAALARALNHGTEAVTGTVLAGSGGDDGGGGTVGPPHDSVTATVTAAAAAAAADAAAAAAATTAAAATGNAATAAPAAAVAAAGGPMARWWAAAAPPPLADRLAHEQAWFREKLFRCPDDDDDGRQLSLSFSFFLSLSLSGGVQRRIPSGWMEEAEELLKRDHADIMLVVPF